MAVEERVGREDVLRVARERFMARERIDMQSLAAGLGIGRTTLYRWVGDRDALVSEVLCELATETLHVSAAKAEGEGLDRVIDEIRGFMTTTSDFAPLRHLVQNEPELSLRVMLAPGSAVSKVLTGEIQGQIEAVRPGWAAEKAADLADVLTQIGMAYEWGNIVVSSEPEIDRAIRAMEMLIRAADSD